MAQLQAAVHAAERCTSAILNNWHQKYLDVSVEVAEETDDHTLLMTHTNKLPQMQ